MSQFIPKVGLITEDSYLHGSGSLDDISCLGKIVYVGADYFVLENLYNKAAYVVNRENYWVIQETDFYEQK